MYILDTHTLLWYLRDSEELCSEKDIYILPIKGNHLDELDKLPDYHNDPFDRLIICQYPSILA